MALSRGSRLGPYEILSAIGAGGMGEVYRARDTKLNRDVALKVLPSALTDDAERAARLQREARLLASLNHPHIGAIYGLEDAGPYTALVLELVEGDTLDERVRRGALAINEVLTLAHQVAEALEAAHSAGVVHRDLKPANIKVTREGTIKVLDFGLARTLATEPASTADPSIALTMTGEGTLPGTILGTAAFMSPEQARGEAVDKRADIWAFGCVVFELLTGSSPFARRNLTDTLAAVVSAEPDWTLLPAVTPSGIRRLLMRCLEKDLRRRLHDIADARIEIEDAIAAPISPGAVAMPRGWKGPAALASALAVAILVFLWAASRDRPEPSVPETRVVRLTDLAGMEEAPAISPDGRSVAFSASVGGRRQLFVKLVAGGAPLQITQDATDHEYPRWAPDSSSIFYFSAAASGDLQGSIWEIPALGGVPRRIVDSVGGADVSQTDGRLALFRLATNSIQLVTAPPDGSGFDVVAEFAPATYYLYPRWSPDGEWIAFQRGDSVRQDLFVTPAAGGEPRQLTHENNFMGGFAWLPEAAGIVYSSSRGSTMPYLPRLGLWQVTLRDGRVRQVTSGESSYVSPDISRSGAMVAGRMRLQTDIWKYPVGGTAAENVRRGVRVTRQTGEVLTPSAGPDDREVAFLSDSGGHANLWVVNTETGVWRQITHERDPDVALGLPVWSPEGNVIAFVSSRGNQGLTFGVWLVNADGSNLRNVANPGLGPAWSPDGRWVYYSTRSGTAVTDVELKKVPVGGGPAVTVRSEQLRNVIGSDGSTLYYLFERPLVDGTPEFEIRAATPEEGPFRVLARIPASRVPLWQTVNPALSPDGKWLAQALTDGLTTNVWALSTSSGEWRQLTDFGEHPTFIARRVSWSADGRSILAAVGEGDSDIVLLEGLIGGTRE